MKIYIYCKLILSGKFENISNIQKYLIEKLKYLDDESGQLIQNIF